MLRFEKHPKATAAKPHYVLFFRHALKKVNVLEDEDLDTHVKVAKLMIEKKFGKTDQKECAGEAEVKQAVATYLVDAPHMILVAHMLKQPTDALKLMGVLPVTDANGREKVHAALRAVKTAHDPSVESNGLQRGHLRHAMGIDALLKYDWASDAVRTPNNPQKRTNWERLLAAGEVLKAMVGKGSSAWAADLDEIKKLLHGVGDYSKWHLWRCMCEVALPDRIAVPIEYRGFDKMSEGVDTFTRSMRRRYGSNARQQRALGLPLARHLSRTLVGCEATSLVKVAKGRGGGGVKELLACLGGLSGGHADRAYAKHFPPPDGGDPTVRWAGAADLYTAMMKDGNVQEAEGDAAAADALE
jgi:hypothetical protein